MSIRGWSWEEPSAAHAPDLPPRMRARKWRLSETAAPGWAGLAAEVLWCAGASTVSLSARGAELRISLWACCGAQAFGL